MRCCARRCTSAAAGSANAACTARSPTALARRPGAHRRRTRPGSGASSSSRGTGGRQANGQRRFRPSVQAADAADCRPRVPGGLHVPGAGAARRYARPRHATLAAGLTRAQLLEKAADVAYLAGANARAVELPQQAVSAIDAGHRTARRGPMQDAARAETFGASAIRRPRSRPTKRRLRLLPGRHAVGRAGPAARRRGPRLHADVAIRRSAPNGPSRRWRRREPSVPGRSRVTRSTPWAAAAASSAATTRAMPLIQQSLEIAEELADPEDLNRAYANLSQSDARNRTPRRGRVDDVRQRRGRRRPLGLPAQRRHGQRRGSLVRWVATPRPNGCWRCSATRPSGCAHPRPGCCRARC